MLPGPAWACPSWGRSPGHPPGGGAATRLWWNRHGLVTAQLGRPPGGTERRW